MSKLNACIVFISSRKKCIKYSLLSLWENYNNKYNYPVYVHYFDDIYDDESYPYDRDWETIQAFSLLTIKPQ